MGKINSNLIKYIFLIVVLNYILLINIKAALKNKEHMI